ncbi:MAG: hypothetical protein ABSB80_08100 [Methanoregula sp.]|jgi:hypothetical protein|uniref:hypothetical protein n=1 Tax=Methanoregula sp. TaxID=2052170 RepID=UPI003D0DB01E
MHKSPGFLHIQEIFPLFYSGAIVSGISHHYNIPDAYTRYTRLATAYVILWEIQEKGFRKKSQFENCSFLSLKNDHIESPRFIPYCSPEPALSGMHKSVQEMMQPMNFFTSVAFYILNPHLLPTRQAGSARTYHHSGYFSMYLPSTVCY